MKCFYNHTPEKNVLYIVHIAWEPSYLNFQMFFETFIVKYLHMTLFIMVLSMQVLIHTANVLIVFSTVHW